MERRSDYARNSGDAESDYRVELEATGYQGSGSEPEVDKFMPDVPARGNRYFLWEDPDIYRRGEPRTAKIGEFFLGYDVDLGQSLPPNVMYGDDVCPTRTEITRSFGERWYFGARYN